jgi:LmbE family N-acetylglucosaminyl deacetylase
VVLVVVLRRPEPDETPPGKEAEERRKPTILVFAPHPDDETLGCAGVLMRAARARLNVRVIFSTNGDGFPKAAALQTGKNASQLTAADYLELARARQGQALEAARTLGLSADSLVFLSYPDAGMAQVLGAADGAPFKSRFTEKASTYGLLFADYHTQTHGSAAPYVRSSAVGDVTELLRSLRPTQVYVTDATDVHKDHSATFELVRAAVLAAKYDGELFTYLVHPAGPGDWPLPGGADPSAPFEASVVKGRITPANISWPPDERRPLSAEEAATKLRAIRAYTLEVQMNRAHIESYVRSEEIFWRKNTRSLRSD